PGRGHREALLPVRPSLRRGSLLWKSHLCVLSKNPQVGGRRRSESLGCHGALHGMGPLCASRPGPKRRFPSRPTVGVKGSSMGTLKGKTLFITGASRGIGKAIALRAARDGANVAVLGKTAEPHARLPGTVPGTVAEIEAAGGKAIGCLCDVRFEDQVQAAVARTVEAFGGIDILVNNASAISLTPTLQTEMKRFDLMHQVNTRGTFLCSKLCLPHLLKSANPHILMLSPPPTLRPEWFANHLAYTIA